MAIYESFTMGAQDSCMEEGNCDETAAGEAHETRYAAFLLRVWRNNASDDWRLVIEEVGSEERRGFNDWEALVRYLRSSIAGPAWRE